LATRLGATKPWVTKLLCGDANLTLNTIVKTFNALGARLDFISAPLKVDEWEIKGYLSELEETYWPSDKQWRLFKGAEKLVAESDCEVPPQPPAKDDFLTLHDLKKAC